MNNDFEGKYSQKRKEQDMQCPKCKSTEVYYLGSNGLHGNPYSPAADSDVAHHYGCENCKHEWTEYV